MSFRVSLPSNVSTDVPKRSKRGRTGGVLSRRLQNTTSGNGEGRNTQSVRNKMDELETCVRFNSEYRESAVIGLNETCLDKNATDTEINLSGFTGIRGDRTSASRKRNGGGVCFYVDERWCNNATATAKVCLQDIDFLTYLPMYGVLPSQSKCRQHV